MELVLDHTNLRVAERLDHLARASHEALSGKNEPTLNQ